MNHLHEAMKGVPDEKSSLQVPIHEETPLFAKDIEGKSFAEVWN